MKRLHPALVGRCPATLARLWSLLLAAGLLLTGLPARAEPPAKAEEPRPGSTATVSRTGPGLSITGTLKNGSRQTVQLSLAELAALPQQHVRTQTPWYPGPRTFSGPLLKDVLDLLGAQGQTLEARAINDYKVSIPVSDASRFKPVLALQIDGKPMALRDKGPIFIVYPYDSDPQLRSSVYYSRSIWQLKALDIR